MAYKAFSSRVRFVREIASALGLDPDLNSITGITLDAQVGMPAVVTVKMLADTSQDEAISEVLRRYRLEENREPTTSDNV